MSDNDKAETVEAPPFDQMDRAGMLHHLLTAHGYDAVKAVGSKVTKDRLTRDHDALHRGNYAHRFPILIPHVHAAIEASEGMRERVEAAREGRRITGDKPLSIQERKVLHTLVDNDFAQLRSEMQALAADVERQRVKEVQEEWRDRVEAARRFEDDVDKVVTDAEAALQRIRREADAMGVEIDIPNVTRNHYQGTSITKVRGFAQAENQVRKEVNQDLNRALMDLERQRLTAQRTVLLNGVTAEAATLLDEVPKAKDMMIEAQQHRERRVIEAANDEDAVYAERREYDAD